METMQGSLKNGRNVWDGIDMPACEFECRIEAVRERMSKEGLDLLLVYGFAFNRYADPAYLTNFIIRLPRGTLLALLAEGKPALFFEGGSRGIPSLRKTTYDCELVAASDNVKDCVKYLSGYGLLPCRVGLAGVRELMPHGQFRVLMEALAGSTISDANAIMREGRMVKSAREADEIRRAGRIVRGLFDALPASAGAFQTERALEAHLFREARYEKAEDVRLLIGRTNREGWYLRPATDRAIGAGETITIHLAVEFERYWAEGARTFKMEGSSFAAADGHLEGAWRRAAEALREGLKASEVYGQVIEAAASAGMEPIGDYGVGEAIGLSQAEAPEINATDGTALAAGMSFALRLVAKDEAAGAVMRGGTVIVTEGDPEVVA